MIFALLAFPLLITQTLNAIVTIIKLQTLKILPNTQCLLLSFGPDIGVAGHSHWSSVWAAESVVGDTELIEGIHRDLASTAPGPAQVPSCKLWASGGSFNSPRDHSSSGNSPCALLQVVLAVELLTLINQV